MEINEDCYIVSGTTGEIVGKWEVGGVYKDPRTVARDRARAAHNKIISAATSLGGYFIWNIYTLTELPLSQINNADLVRLMYVSTYLNNDGYLQHRKGSPIKKSEIQALLGISATTFKQFWRTMTKSGLLLESSGRIYPNGNVFRRGKYPSKRILKEMASDGQYIMRLYIKGIRDLYLSSASRSSVGNIFRLFPYVNREYNVCCYNPTETDPAKIDVMSLAQIAHLLGYDSTHVRRFGYSLADPSFVTPTGKSVAAVSFHVNDPGNVLNGAVVINPCIFYVGHHWDEVIKLGQF